MAVGGDDDDGGSDVQSANRNTPSKPHRSDQIVAAAITVVQKDRKAKVSRPRNLDHSHISRERPHGHVQE